MNLLQTGRISLLSVAENIITCLSWGVILKISWTSLRMSGEYIHKLLRELNTMTQREMKNWTGYHKVKMDYSKYRNLPETAPYQVIQASCHIHQE